MSVLVRPCITEVNEQNISQCAKIGSCSSFNVAVHGNGPGNINYC